MRKIGIATLGLALLFAGCEDREDGGEGEMTLQEAYDEGLLIEGFQDVEGIRSVATYHVAAVNTAANVLAERAGFIEDAETAAQASALANAAILANLSIESIDFVPGLGSEGTEASINFWSGLGDPPDETPGGEFAAGFPTSDSLVGTRTVTYTRDPEGNVIGKSVRVDNGNGYTVYRVFPDGSTTGFSRSVSEDGSRTSTSSYAIDADGSLRHAEERVTDTETGEDVEPPRSEGSDTEPSGTTNVRGGVVEGGDRPSGGGSVEAPDKVDQFQPADGMEGGYFCPLTLDVCRREMERALESREDVYVGVVLINPAEPDVMPEAARLVFDTESLVINPDPTVVESDGQLPPSSFRMRLPVWVLPPRPGLFNTERINTGG